MKLPDVSRLEFDEKKHAYKLDGRLMSGVTTVIDGTSSKGNLIDWAANCAVDYIKERVPGNDRQEGLNQITYRIEDFNEMLEEARKAHTRKKEKAGSKGTDTHALVEEYINKCIEHCGGVPALLPDHKELLPFKEWAQSNVNRFIAAEQRLYSEKYGYAGTCDFIAIIDEKLTIGDLKTFPKMWSADAFIQMGAYSLAWNELTGEKPAQSVVIKMCDPEDERLKKYGGKAFAVYPRYALEEDEDMFLTRLKTYRYNQNFTSPKE